MPQPRPAPVTPEPPIAVSEEARRMIISLAARSVVATEACLRDPESAECREAKAEEDYEIAKLSRYVGGLEAYRDRIRDGARGTGQMSEPAHDDAEGWRVEAECAWSEYADIARVLGFPHGGPHHEILAAAHRLASTEPESVWVYPLSPEEGEKR